MGTHRSPPTPGLPLVIQTLSPESDTEQMPSPAHLTADRQTTDDTLNEEL